jgi:DNA-binding HxlR family transcriptional regulator
MKLDECPITHTLSFIGGKWKPLILHQLREGPLRPGELAKRIPEVTLKVLTQQLRELERDGIIIRKVFPVVPPHVEYDFSPFGQSLRPVLKALCLWGERHASRKRSSLSPG